MAFGGTNRISINVKVKVSDHESKPISALKFTYSIDLALFFRVASYLLLQWSSAIIMDASWINIDKKKGWTQLWRLFLPTFMLHVLLFCADFKTLTCEKVREKNMRYKISKKNPAHGRQSISRPMWLEALIQKNPASKAKFAKKIQLFLHGNFTIFMSKSFQIWDHLFLSLLDFGEKGQKGVLTE